MKFPTGNLRGRGNGKWLAHDSVAHVILAPHAAKSAADELELEWKGSWKREDNINMLEQSLSAPTRIKTSIACAITSWWPCEVTSERETFNSISTAAQHVPGLQRRVSSPHRRYHYLAAPFGESSYCWSVYSLSWAFIDTLVLHSHIRMWCSIGNQSGRHKHLGKRILRLTLKRALALAGWWPWLERKCVKIRVYEWEGLSWQCFHSPAYSFPIITLPLAKSQVLDAGLITKLVVQPATLSPTAISHGWERHNYILIPYSCALSLSSHPDDYHHDSRKIASS